MSQYNEPQVRDFCDDVKDMVGLSDAQAHAMEAVLIAVRDLDAEDSEQILEIVAGIKDGTYSVQQGGYTLD